MEEVAAGRSSARGEHFGYAGYRQLSLAPDTNIRRLQIPLSRSTPQDPMRIAGRSDVEVKIHEDRFVTMTGRLTDDDSIPVEGAKVYFGSSARKVVPLKSTIHFLNDYGERINILVLDAQGCRRRESWAIEGDSTQVLCASQRVKTLVLTGPDGMEISRPPIHLVPEFITEIDLWEPYL